MFIFFQKCQFVYQNNLISPPIRQFPLFSIVVTWHVTWPQLNVKVQENLKIYFWEKVQFVLGLLAGNIGNYAYAQMTSLTQALIPLR